MKNILDYTHEIVELGNVLQTSPKSSHKHLIIHQTVFKAKETAQLFELTDGSRIKKSSLGEVKSLNQFYPEFKAYCLPDKIEETKVKLLAAVNKQNEKMLSVFQHIKSQLEAGEITMTDKEYRSYLMAPYSSPSP
jgi:hypothetical protein